MSTVFMIVLTGVWYNDDPMTGSAKRKQQFKMLFFTGMPIISLVAISLYALSESVQKRVDLMEVRWFFVFFICNCSLFRDTEFKKNRERCSARPDE